MALSATCGTYFTTRLAGGRACHVRPCCSNVADLSISSLGRDLAGVARPFLFGFRRMLALSPHFILCGSAALALTGHIGPTRCWLGISLNMVNTFNGRCILAAFRANLSVFLAAFLCAPVSGRRLQELQFAARAADCSLGGRFLVLLP